MKKTPTQNDMQAFVDADFTAADIALYNKWSVAKVRYWLKKFGLQAAREKGSIGAKAFKVFLQHTFPAFPIEEEYHIGNRLRLDFYIPGMYTAFEVDGDPHNETVPLFHGGEEGYQRAVERDRRKNEWCEENNILLIRVTAALAIETRLHPETRDAVIDSIRDQIAEAQPTGPAFEEKKKKPVSERYSKYLEDMKNLSREARKTSYRKAKAIKDRLKKEAKIAKRNALQGD